MRKLVAFAVVSAALLSGMGSANAQVATNISRCEARDASIDDLIVHCTVAIKSGRLTAGQEARAFLNRGTAFFDRAQYSLAIRDYGFAEERDASLSAIYANRANALIRMGEGQRAVLENERALKLDPQDVQSMIGRGGALMQLTRYSDAAQSFTQALSIDPQNTTALYNRGLAAMRLDRAQQAASDFGQVIQLNPQDAEAFAFRAQAFEKIGELNRAYENYSRAIQIDDGYSFAWFRRGKLMVDDGRPKEGNPDLARAYKLGYNDPWLAEYVVKLGRGE